MQEIQRFNKVQKSIVLFGDVLYKHTKYMVMSYSKRQQSIIPIHPTRLRKRVVIT